MKKKNITFSVALLFGLVLFSCTEQKIVPFSLFISTDKPLPTSQDGLLPAEYSTLLNYYDDTVVYVPECTMERSDLAYKEIVLVPLSGVNKFRKSLDLLSAINLKEDYTENINKVRLGKGLLKTEGKPGSDTVAREINPEAIVLDLQKYNNDTAKVVKKKILTLLQSGKKTISIVFRTNSTSQMAEPISQTVVDEPLNKNPSAATVVAGKPAVQKSPETRKDSDLTNPRTIKYDNGDWYVGEVSSTGKPEGAGVMHYDAERQISGYDPNVRAEAGDHFSGSWSDGLCESGILYDKNNHRKGTYHFGLPEKK